jgi:hypothetical protein
MPKATNSQRTRRVRNRATISYGDEPCGDGGGRNITVSQSATGRVLRSTALASKLETGTSSNGDFADPWTTGFFDSNTEAFVDDSPLVWAPDELLDSVPLESLPEPKDRRMVRMAFTFKRSPIDKNS